MSEPFVGEIRMVGFHFAPRGWAFCDGQLLPVSQNDALFSLLGTTYGGDGETSFALPDLRGRAPIHKDAQHPLGEKGGANDHTLSIEEMPEHTHELFAYTADATEAAPGKGNQLALTEESIYAPASNLQSLAPESVGEYGGGLSFSLMQPYLGIYFCIALTGLYPSVN